MISTRNEAQVLMCISEVCVKVLYIHFRSHNSSHVLDKHRITCATLNTARQAVGSELFSEVTHFKPRT